MPFHVGGYWFVQLDDSVAGGRGSERVDLLHGRPRGGGAGAVPARDERAESEVSGAARCGDELDVAADARLSQRGADVAAKSIRASGAQKFSCDRYAFGQF